MDMGVFNKTCTVSDIMHIIWETNLMAMPVAFMTIEIVFYKTSRSGVIHNALAYL